MVRERTEFESKLERLIEDRYTGLLDDIDDLVSRTDNVDSSMVEKAIIRFGGHELSDMWQDYILDGEL